MQLPSRLQFIYNSEFSHTLAISKRKRCLYFSLWLKVMPTKAHDSSWYTCEGPFKVDRCDIFRNKNEAHLFKWGSGKQKSKLLSSQRKHLLCLYSLLEQNNCLWKDMIQVLSNCKMKKKDKKQGQQKVRKPR